MILGFSAYFIWGLAPIFFKFLENVPTYEIIAHRIIWSLVLLMLIITLTQNWDAVKKVANKPKTILYLLLSSVLMLGNWTIFVWAINHNHVLESSLGYFICPLASIILAIIFLKERFRLLQWLALILAGTGILIQLWAFGSLPKIALGLAISFSLYGFARKKIGVEAIPGLFFETLWLLPVALIYLSFFAGDSPTRNIFQNSASLNVLLMACGIITTVPLILFNAAAVRVKFSTLGLLQYIGPTMAFLLAIFAYHEPMNTDKWVTFGFIWAGLALFVWDSIKTSHKTQRLS